MQKVDRVKIYNLCMHEVVKLDTTRKRRLIRHWYHDAVDAIYRHPTGGVFAMKGEDEWRVLPYRNPKTNSVETLPPQKIGEQRYPRMYKVALERDDRASEKVTGKAFRVYAIAYAPLGEVEKGPWEKQLPPVVIPT